MKPFLYYVAQDLIARFGNNLSDLTIVFPGKRAQLYMNSFLSHFAQGPVWAPRFKTIDELFLQFSSLTPSDTILNVCTLYSIYVRYLSDAAPFPLRSSAPASSSALSSSPTLPPPSLDDFYAWGEILLQDFDDIDKHLVDANKLFANTADLAALDSTDYLTDNQVEALRHFFANFNPDHQTELKRRFLEMWKAMPHLYHQLKETLRSQGLMYKGALYREVAEHILQHPEAIHTTDASGTSREHYAFVGFNVLDEVEEVLFRTFRDSGHALFYWDYDLYYTTQHDDHEAGLFLRHNLEHYPNALNSDIFNNLLNKDKKIRLLATSTDNAQVRFLPQWIEKQLTTPEHETAVILCDEALMRPALHSLPPGINANITMGYPLTDTAIHGYFSSLLDLQIDSYNPDLDAFLPTAVERVEKNPFFPSFPPSLLPFTRQSDNLALIDWLISAVESLGKSLGEVENSKFFDEPNGKAENSPLSTLNSQLSILNSQLYTEATFQIYRILGQFRWLITNGTLRVQPNTLRRLIRQVLSTTKIPFHGEMDEGLQVMGVLEARNLDFRHLIMLSVGEGIIPRRTSETSLIPYILRAHFGLDTTERQDSVYAYSFYRLLQRAEDITLVYNNNSSGTAQREQSRFLRQLQTETDLNIEEWVNGQSTAFTPQPPIQVEKDERILSIMHDKKYLSPTSINRYIECPLKFYFQDVARIRIPDRPQDGIDNALFGTIFHDTCEFFYNHLRHITGRNDVQRSDLSALLFPRSEQPTPASEHKAKHLSPYIDLIFWVDYFHAHEYDSREHAKEREQFLAKYEAAGSLADLKQMVIDLYAADKGLSCESFFTGVNMIIHDVVLELFFKLLQWDMAHTPFTIYGMEQEASTALTVPSGDKNIEITIGGRIDRMDIMNINGRPTLRIVDYKTGREKASPGTIEAIFSASGHNAHGYYLQTFLYALVMSRKERLPVSPCLFYVLSAADAQTYDPTLVIDKQPVADIREYAAEYTKGLTKVLSEIYDPALPFVQTEDAKHCQYCDFRQLCAK